jgi:hypothetical protein
MDWVLVRAHEVTEPIPRTVVRRIKRASKTLLCIAPVPSIASQTICRNENMPAHQYPLDTFPYFAKN